MGPPESAEQIVEYGRQHAVKYKTRDLRRWAKAGVLVPLDREIAIPGRGSVALYAPGSCELAVECARLLRARYRLVDIRWMIPWRRWWRGDDRCTESVARTLQGAALHQAWIEDAIFENEQGTTLRDEAFDVVERVATRRSWIRGIGTLKRRLRAGLFETFLIQVLRIVLGRYVGLEGSEEVEAALKRPGATEARIIEHGLGVDKLVPLSGKKGEGKRHERVDRAARAMTRAWKPSHLRALAARLTAEQLSGERAFLFAMLPPIVERLPEVLAKNVQRVLVPLTLIGGAEVEPKLFLFWFACRADPDVLRWLGDVLCSLGVDLSGAPTIT